MFGGSQLGPWTKDYNTKATPWYGGTADWYWRSPSDGFVGIGGNGDLTIIEKKWSEYADYENDLYAWRTFANSGGSSGSIRFSFKMSGGPFPRTGAFSHSQLELECNIAEQALKAGLSSLGQYMYLHMYTGYTTPGGSDPNGLYALAFGSVGLSANTEYAEVVHPAPPILTNIWGRWIDVRIDVTKSSIRAWIWFQGDPEPGSPQVRSVWADSELGILHRAEQIGMLSYGLSSNTIGSPVGSIEITGLAVDWGDCGWSERFDRPPQSGWGLTEFSGLPAKYSEPGNQHLFEIRDENYGLLPEVPQRGGFQNLGVLDYVAADNPVGDPFVHLPLGFDLLALADASPNGYVDIDVHMMLSSYVAPVGQGDVSWRVILSSLIPSTLNPGYWNLGPSTNVDMTNTEADGRKAQIWGLTDPQLSTLDPPSGESTATDFKVINENSMWLYVRISRTSVKAMLTSVDSRLANFDNRYVALSGGTMTGVRDHISFGIAFLNARAVLEVNEIHITDGARACSLSGGTRIGGSVTIG